MRALALLLSLLIAVPARAQSPFIFGGGGQAKALNQNGITLKTGQTLSYDGPDNWIKNGRAADPVIVGMGTYDDGASATPVDCTGGAPSVVSAPSISSGEYQFVKSAADGRGEGIYVDITVPANTPSTTAMFELIQRVVSGTYASGDVGVYIYDVTNGGTPTKLFDLGNTTSSRIGQPWTWVTSSTSTTYRACIHVQTTSASAYTLGFDNLYAGIEKNGPVPVMPYVSWEPWTPSGSWSTNTTYANSFQARVNDTWFFRTTITLAGAPDATTLTISPPSGLTFDTTKFGTNSNLGAAWLFDSGTVANSGTGTIRVTGGNIQVVAPNGSDVTAAVPFTWASGDQIRISGAIPIAEWASPSYASPGSQCEYAATSGTWDGSSSTTVFGINGQPMGGALTAQRDKTVTFNNPVRFIRVLGSNMAGGIGWTDINNSRLGPSSLIVSKITQAAGAGTSSGVTWRMGASNREVIVSFLRYLRVSTDGTSSLTDWPSSNAYWVVENCPTAQGSIVYSLANNDAPGLNYGVNVITDQSASAISNNVQTDIGTETITLPAGEYLLEFGARCAVTFSVAATRVESIFVVTDSSNVSVSSSYATGCQVERNATSYITMHNFYQKVTLTATSTTIKLRGTINVTGGTISDRSFSAGYIKATRLQ